MAQLLASDDIQSLTIQLSDIAQTSFRSSFQTNSTLSNWDDEYLLQWAAIDRLPTFERLKSSLFDDDDHKGKRLIDVTKLTATQRHMLIEKLIKHIGNDNLHLLHKLRKRIDKVGVKLPSVEVRYKILRVEAECEVVQGKPLPTIWNSFQSMLSDIAKLPGFRSKQTKISIINHISGIIKPGRSYVPSMTLNKMFNKIVQVVGFAWEITSVRIVNSSMMMFRRSNITVISVGYEKWREGQFLSL